jgi:hypothetical protein
MRWYSVTVPRMPWVAKVRLKVKPMAEASTRKGMSPLLTSQPPRPYRESREACTAARFRDSRLALAQPNLVPQLYAASTKVLKRSRSRDSPAKDLQGWRASGWPRDDKFVAVLCCGTVLCFGTEKFEERAVSLG